MAEMTDAQFKQKVLDVLDETGAFIKNDIEQVSTVDGNVILPGYSVTGEGDPVKYVCAPMTVFAQYAERTSDNIQQTWDDWFGIDATTEGGVQKQWDDLKTDSEAATGAANAVVTDWMGEDGTGTTSGLRNELTEAEAARAEAETARADAETARSQAETTRSQAESARAQAEQSRSQAETARVQAESDRLQAETARSQAEAARVQAEQVRVDEFASSKSAADTAAAAATTAANNATAVVTAWGDSNSGKLKEINDAIAAAGTATTGAENVDAMLGSTGGIVTLTVTSRSGQQTSKEVGFRIAKTYPSVAAMNADAPNVEVGRFVMIDGDVEQADTGKLYVKNSSGGFTYLADLSGAQGMKGDTPVMTATADGVIYADGKLLTDIIKNAVDTFETNEGTSSSTAGDGSRWGTYKTAEHTRNGEYTTAEENRNSQYSTAEQTRNTSYGNAEGTSTSTAGDGTRWGAYKTAETSRDGNYSTAESARDTQYGTAEGSSTATAGDGSRWGAYKTAEQTRNGEYTTAEGSRDSQYSTAEQTRNTSYTNAEGTSTSTAGDGSRWGAYKTAETNRNGEYTTAEGNRNSQYSTAEQTRNTSYGNAEGTSSSTAGDGTRWGAYKTAETSRDGEYSTAESARDTLYGNAEGTSSSTAGDGTRWGAYKTAETSRDGEYSTAENGRNTQYGNAEGTSTSTAGDGSRWGAYKSAEAARNTTWTDWFSDSLATGVRKLWNDFWPACKSTWETWFGTSTSTGVQGEWAALKTDAEAATDAANAVVTDWLGADGTGITSGLRKDITTAETARAQAEAARVQAEQVRVDEFASSKSAADTAASNATTQANRAKAYADHPSYIGDGTTGDLNYWYIWNEATSSYVKDAYAKGDDLHYDEMTEAEKEDLAARVLEELVFDQEPTEGSTNPVESNGIYDALSQKADKNEMAIVPGTGDDADKTTITLKTGTSATVLTQHQSIPTTLSSFTDDSTHRLVTDTEKQTWNNKQDALTFATTEECTRAAAEISFDLPA